MSSRSTSTLLGAKSRRGGSPQAIGSLLSPLRPARGELAASEQEAISAYVGDLAKEFSDRAPLRSSVTRAGNLYRQAGVSLPVFLDRLFLAAATVREATDSGIRGRGRPITNRMSYFFSVLSSKLGVAAGTRRAKQLPHLAAG